MFEDQDVVIVTSNNIGIKGDKGDPGDSGVGIPEVYVNNDIPLVDTNIVWVDEDSVVVPSFSVPVSYASDLSSGNSNVITHNLNTRDIIVSVYRVSDGAEISNFTYICTSYNTIILSSSIDLTGYRVVILASSGLLVTSGGSGTGYMGVWDKDTNYLAGSIVTYGGKTWGTKGGASAGNVPAEAPQTTGIGSDNFINATRIYVATDNSNIPSTTFDNTFYTTESGEPATAQSRSAWWVYTPINSGVVTFSSGDSTNDTIMAMYSLNGAPSFANLTLVVSDDDAGPGSTSMFSYNVVGGTTYYIQLGAYSGIIQTYGLLLTNARATAALTSSWTLLP